MTVERIIVMMAGFFVMLSLALSYYHHPYWMWFTAFVGFNLFQSGITGFCPMAIVLKKLGVATEASKVGTC